MPKRMAVAVIVVAFLTALPLWAQQQTTLFQPTKTSSSLIGANPANIKLVPINTAAALKSFQSSNLIRSPQMPSTPWSTLTSMMPKVSLPSFTPKIGSGSVPGASAARRSSN